MAGQTYGVLGATGQQGGAVVNALLDGGHGVRAIVRNPDSDRARRLRARGVDVVRGDQDEPAELAGPFAGLDALYLMSTFDGEGGTEREYSRAAGVVDAAVSAGVPRLVHSSVGGADRDSGVPHFESKYRIERHASAALPTQIVRPVFFMDNLAAQLGDEGELVLRLAMPADVPLQLIATRDIGVVAAAALVDADAIGDAGLEIAGDELTPTEIAARLGAHLGRPARFEQVPLDVLGDDDLEAMFRWFVETPAYRADFDRTRALDPDVLDLDGWVAATGSRQAQ